MLIRLTGLAILAGAGVPAFAQSIGPVPTALPFLELTPSPTLLGVGGAGVAQPGAGAYVGLANPALLGLAARDVTAATASGPGASDWRGLGDIHLSGGAQSIGVERMPWGLPVSAGAAVSWATVGYGHRLIAGSVATYEPSDRYAALSFGVSTRGPVRVAIGSSVRAVSTTDRAEVRRGRTAVSHRRGLTADLGAALSVDVAALAARTFDAPAAGRVRPALELTAGYTQAHIGGRMRYSGGEWQALPRTARLGWGAVAGLDLDMQRAGLLRAVEGEIAIQADTRLVHEERDGEFTYDRMLGDVGAVDAIAGRGDAMVTGRRGLRVAALETVSFSWGVFGGGGYDNERSRAVEVRLAGPLKLAAALTGNERLAGTASRFDLRWTRAVTFVGSPYETTMHGFSVVVRR